MDFKMCFSSMSLSLRWEMLENMFLLFVCLFFSYLNLIFVSNLSPKTTTGKTNWETNKIYFKSEMNTQVKQTRLKIIFDLLSWTLIPHCTGICWKMFISISSISQRSERNSDEQYCTFSFWDILKQVHKKGNISARKKAKVNFQEVQLIVSCFLLVYNNVFTVFLLYLHWLLNVLETTLAADMQN